MTPAIPVSDSDGIGVAWPPWTRTDGTPVGRSPASGDWTSSSSAPKRGPWPAPPTARPPATPRSRNATLVPGRTSPSNEFTDSVRRLSSSRALRLPRSITMSGRLLDDVLPSSLGFWTSPWPSPGRGASGAAALPRERPRTASSSAETLSSGPPRTAAMRIPVICTGPRMPNATPNGTEIRSTLTSAGRPSAPPLIVRSSSVMLPMPASPLPTATGTPSRSEALLATTRATRAPTANGYSTSSTRPTPPPIASRGCRWAHSVSRRPTSRTPPGRGRA